MELAELCIRLDFSEWMFEHLYPLLDESHKRKFKPTNDDVVQELTVSK